MRLDPRALAVTASAISALGYSIGAILHLALPWGAPALATFVFRVEVVGLSTGYSTLSFVTGVALFAFFGALFGYLGGWMYNRLAASGARQRAGHPSIEAESRRLV